MQRDGDPQLSLVSLHFLSNQLIELGIYSAFGSERRKSVIKIHFEPGYGF